MQGSSTPPPGTQVPSGARRFSPVITAFITKWVGNAWSRIKTSLKDTIVRSFLKCGISNKLDKSEDHLVSIRGLEGYEMPEPEREFHLQSDDESEDDSEMSYDVIVLLSLLALFSYPRISPPAYRPIRL